jgi:hypothetical protein
MRSASRFGSPTSLGCRVTLFLAISQVSPTLFGRAERDALPSTPVTIRVYDQVPLDRNDLREAEAVAGQVFKRVAVDISWLDVPDPFLGPPALDYSNNPPAPCLHEMGVKIVRSTPPGTAPGVLAMTLPRSRGALQIVVYWERVQEYQQLNHLANLLCPNIATVLGYVLVHEVGHVLLGSTEHSESGIMRAHWGLPELQKMVWGRFTLAKTESTTIYRRCGAW